jgi:carbon monoxide dehydrogenase subunit G
MHIGGKVNVKASRRAVWSVLTDAEAVSRCTPGLESMEVLVPGRIFRAVGAIGVGSMKVRFTTEVEWLELHPPRRAVMKLSGRGRRSSVQVGSEVLLADGADGSTDMEWAADVTVKGTLDKLAARLMKPATYQMTGEFFNCIKRKIESGVMTDF